MDYKEFKKEQKKRLVLLKQKLTEKDYLESIDRKIGTIRTIMVIFFILFLIGAFFSFIGLL